MGLFSRLVAPLLEAGFFFIVRFIHRIAPHVLNFDERVVFDGSCWPVCSTADCSQPFLDRVVDQWVSYGCHASVHSARSLVDDESGGGVIHSVCRLFHSLACAAKSIEEG